MKHDLASTAPDRRGRVLEVLAYGTSRTGVRHALCVLEGGAVVPVPLTSLRAYTPRPDRVVVPAEVLGDLLYLAAVAVQDRQDVYAERVRHALAATHDALLVLEPWEGSKDAP